jgi:hypothetical protein
MMEQVCVGLDCSEVGISQKPINKMKTIINKICSMFYIIEYMNIDNNYFVKNNVPYMFIYLI